MKRTLIIVIILSAMFVSQVLSQDIYLSPSHEVYDFLKRMEAKHMLVDYKDAALPLSRMTLAKMLKSLESHVQEMTHVEQETYAFLSTEFKYELLKISGDSEPTEVRWHLFSTDLNEGVINFDINYSLSRMKTDEKATLYRSQGIKTYGYVLNTVGFYFNLVDNLEKGDNVNYSRFNDKRVDELGFLTSVEKDYYKRIKTPFRGIIPSQVNNPKQFQYDEIDAQISWQTGSFTFSLEKMNNVWGYGRNGSVIFSENAPSYPQIKMRVPLSKDIDFIYFHGELNSVLVDSSRSYLVAYPNQSYSKYREVDRTKYIAAHQLEISLWKGVDFSIGESVVYSDKGPLFLYLIPVMFFKAGEHYNNDLDNCQLFGSIDLNLIKNVNAYLSLFIDEINTDKLFDPNLSHRQVAFSSGIRVYDIPAENFDMTLEYTRVNPATYNHSYPTTTFTNNGFILGNWMGQNADNLFLEIGFSPKHALHLTAFGEIFRKGGVLPLADQYSENQGNWKFLFGPLHIERSIGITAKYQVFRDVFVNGHARLQKIEDEADPSKNRPNQFEFSLGVSLGIW